MPYQCEKAMLRVELINVLLVKSYFMRKNVKLHFMGQKNDTEYNRIHRTGTFPHKTPTLGPLVSSLNLKIV